MCLSPLPAEGDKPALDIAKGVAASAFDVIGDRGEGRKDAGEFLLGQPSRPVRSTTLENYEFEANQVCNNALSFKKARSLQR